MAKVLIVDDQKSVLLTLEAVISKEGHAVVSCTNSMDALNKLNEEKFDLLITDAIMPGGNTGYALVRSVRAHPKLARLPVIMVTGKREKADVERGLDAGADDYVIKPIDPEILTAKIRNLLSAIQVESTKFAEAPIRAKAEWESKTEIVAVSELGLTLVSNLAMSPGMRARVSSDLFERIGISVPNLRVASCESDPTIEGQYRIRADFVGIGEKELQPLRLWIRNRSL